MSNLFRPNAIDATADALAALEPWQQLVMALHFAPHMTDCVKLDFRYGRNEDGEIEGYSKSGKHQANLCAECDTDEPWETLANFYTWPSVAATLALLGMRRLDMVAEGEEL